jgi:hypothetical protein
VSHMARLVESNTILLDNDKNILELLDTFLEKVYIYIVLTALLQKCSNRPNMILSCSNRILLDIHLTINYKFILIHL